MNLSRSVFISKYLNKKHSVSSLFLTIMIICASFLVVLLLLLFSQPQKPGNASLLLPALIPGLIILIIGGFIMLPAKPVPQQAIKSNMTNPDGDQAEQLNDLNNEKKYFASVLSHDLRSPLSSIVLLASYLKSKEGLTDTNHYIELIEQSARKELEMMTTLLSLMRADAFNPENVEEVNLKSLAEEIIPNLEQYLSLKDLKLNLDIPPDCRVTTDRQTFSFIFKNLIMQAIRYSDPEQALNITVREERNQIIVELQIISKELSKQRGEQLFTSEQLSDQQSGKAFPESIDLYFCRKAAKGHNGTIHVQTNENTPACRFILALERQRPEQIA